MRNSRDAWNNDTLFQIIETFWNDTIGGRVEVAATDAGGSYIRPTCATSAILLARSCDVTSADGRWFDNIQIVVDFRNRFTNGPTYYDANGRVYDIYALGRHEFGHWVGFSDHNIEPTSTNYIGPSNDTGDRWPGEGDKRGVAMLYGPFTGFDYTRAEGITHPTSEPDYNPPGANQAVVNWFGQANTPPELSPVFASSETSFNNVTPQAGDRMERFAGTATQPYSYLYYRLFTWDDGKRAPTPGKATTTVPNGGKLKWCQYNYQQDTMSVDAQYYEYGPDGRIITTPDGKIIYKWLRDNPAITDQNGYRIHPALRAGKYAYNTLELFRG